MTTNVTANDPIPRQLTLFRDGGAGWGRSLHAAQRKRSPPSATHRAQRKVPHRSQIPALARECVGQDHVSLEVGFIG
jgi:hypothetical protein